MHELHILPYFLHCQICKYIYNNLKSVFELICSIYQDKNDIMINLQFRPHATYHTLLYTVNCNCSTCAKNRHSARRYTFIGKTNCASLNVHKLNKTLIFATGCAHLGRIMFNIKVCREEMAAKG